MTTDWIRVSERVPENDRRIYVTVLCRDPEHPRYVCESFWRPDVKMFDYDYTHELKLIVNHFRVIAWREKESIEPYKGKP